PVTEAEQELIRAFIDNAELAAEFLPRLVEEGLVSDLAGEGIFHKLLAEHQQAGRLEIRRIEALLAPGEGRILFQLQFASGPPPDRERVLACCEALRRRRIDRGRSQLQAEIERAEKEQNQEKLTRLLEAKADLIRGLAGAQRV
ncbi:MAG TPA: hypothetical protein VJX67_05360, partial [Blastocatellia bacterium]|nr:hypothetical protein [Blastocatellia bacterium]